MPGIGETLREARMRQKIDISDVEQATKIRAKYLRALENEEFESLQGATFVRSFLRTYARHLGLDPQRLIEEYRAHHEPRDELEVPHIAPRPQRRREALRAGGPGPPGRGAALAATVLGVLAFLLVLGLAAGDGEDESPERAAGTAAQEEREREEAARERRERPERAQREERQEQRSEPSRVRLRIAPQGPTYVCVDRGPDTDVVFEGTISEPRSFRGRHIRLNLGRTSAKVTVDGDEVAIEQGANPVGLAFRPGESEPIPSGQRPCQ